MEYEIDRQEIIDALARGEIDYEEAYAMLAEISEEAGVEEAAEEYEEEEEEEVSIFDQYERYSEQPPCDDPEYAGPFPSYQEADNWATGDNGAGALWWNVDQEGNAQGYRCPSPGPDAAW